MTKTSTTYNLTSAVLAFLFWGGWSFYINSSEHQSGLIYGVVQGIISFFMALFMVYAVTKIYNSINNQSLKLLLPAFIVTLVMTIILVSIHSLIQTPHILYTISPSLSMAFVFCIITAKNLNNSSNTN